MEALVDHCRAFRKVINLFERNNYSTGTSTAKCFAYHKSSVGNAIQKAESNAAANDSVSADITWHGDRASHFINHMMSGNAVMIDDTGVIEGNVNDTTGVATS